MQWFWEMDFGFHAVTCKIRPQFVATFNPYDEKVVEISCR